MYINVPRAYHFDTLCQEDINALIEKKIDKEANRYIIQWPAEKISIENGRWGPFIRFNKKMLKLYRKPDGVKYTPEEVLTIDIALVKNMIEEQVPNAFTKKTTSKRVVSKTVKKTATKKKAVKNRLLKKIKSQN